MTREYFDKLFADTCLAGYGELVEKAYACSLEHLPSTEEECRSVAAVIESAVILAEMGGDDVTPDMLAAHLLSATTAVLHAPHKRNTAAFSKETADLLGEFSMLSRLNDPKLSMSVIEESKMRPSLLALTVYEIKDTMEQWKERSIPFKDVVKVANCSKAGAAALLGFPGMEKLKALYQQQQGLIDQMLNVQNYVSDLQYQSVASNMAN